MFQETQKIWLFIRFIIFKTNAHVLFIPTYKNQ